MTLTPETLEEMGELEQALRHEEDRCYRGYLEMELTELLREHASDLIEAAMEWGEYKAEKEREKAAASVQANNWLKNNGYKFSEDEGK